MRWIKLRWLLLVVVAIASATPAPAAEKPLLIVANKHDNTLCYVDPESYKILETIATGPNPHEIVITPDGRYAYLSNYAPPGNTISLIDLPGRKHVKQISTGEATRIHGAAIAPDGKFAYFTAGQTGLVVEVDTSTQSVARTIPTEGKISHMVLVSPDGKRLYTANIESEDVSVIDRATGRLITKIPCGKGVEGIAFTPDGKHLWAANQTGGTMTIIDAATRSGDRDVPLRRDAGADSLCPGRPNRPGALLVREGRGDRPRHGHAQGDQANPGRPFRDRRRTLARRHARRLSAASTTTAST